MRRTVKCQFKGGVNLSPTLWASDPPTWVVEEEQIQVLALPSYFRIWPTIWPNLWYTKFLVQVLSFYTRDEEVNVMEAISVTGRNNKEVFVIIAISLIDWIQDNQIVRCFSNRQCFTTRLIENLVQMITSKKAERPHLVCSLGMKLPNYRGAGGLGVVPRSKALQWIVPH